MSRYDIDRPGRVLRELLDAASMSPAKLASSTGVPLQNLMAVLNGEMRVTPDLAHCLAERFRTSESFWLDLQQRADRHMCRVQRNQLRPD